MHLKHTHTRSPAHTHAYTLPKLFATQTDKGLYSELSVDLILKLLIHTADITAELCAIQKLHKSYAYGTDFGLNTGYDFLRTLARMTFVQHLVKLCKLLTVGV